MVNRNTFIVTKKELMILFNALFDSDQEPEIKFTAPVLGDPLLFKLKPGLDMAQFSDFISETHYNRFKEALVKKMSNKKKQRRYQSTGI